jgi:hypothetical protein
MSESERLLRAFRAENKALKRQIEDLADELRDLREDIARKERSEREMLRDMVNLMALTLEASRIIGELRCADRAEQSLLQSLSEVARRLREHDSIENPSHDRLREINDLKERIVQRVNRTLDNEVKGDI